MADESGILNVASIWYIDHSLGMLLWIMMSHDLWESVKQSRNKRITWLYNLTTVMTLFVAIIIYYIILYIILIAELVLLPSDFLGQQVGLKRTGIDLYLSIPWFVFYFNCCRCDWSLDY